MNRLKRVQYLFDHSADRYEADIAPVLAPLVADFAAYAAPRPTDRALDIGTGTGILARALAPYVRHVTGVDISRASLRVARATPAPLNVQYARADIHRLPFRSGSFDLVAASLGLNATFPHHSLRAVREVIAAGGRLVIQEWGPVTDVDRALGETLEAHTAPESATRTPAYPADDDDARDWGDYLQDPDDYREWLGDLGLTVTDARESQPVAVRLAEADDYLRYKLAWTYRWEAVRAMDVPTRTAFYAAARARLAEFTAPDGSLIWQPWLIRVTAQA